MDHLFDVQDELPGYRLHRLEVFNWGTFDSSDGRIHCFEPQGRTSLLVGHNGSGKSTLVDAILTLLVDSRSRNYNVAAGAKRAERTAKSYIKGAYDRTTDETQSSVVRFLRPRGNHLSAISAVFRDDQLGQAFTLTQILHLKSDSDDKVYAIADEARELKDVLHKLVRSDEVRDHLKRKGFQTTRSYADYLGWITRRTGMRSKAVDMFNQTVHVKDIQSLNGFIRRHMLEANDWREKVQRLLTHFNDLSVAHQELVRARRAEELLRPVEKIGVRYREQAAELESLDRQLQAAPLFFADQLVRLYEPEITRQERVVVMIVETTERLERELVAIRETIRRLKNEIEMAGGERLRSIPGLIAIETTSLNHKRSGLDRYLENLRICGIEQPVVNAEQFATARTALENSVGQTESRLAVLKEESEKSVGLRASIDVELQTERAELEMLQQRRTNLPGQFTTMRSRICTALNLDENVLPFAAELIQVLADQRRWESSIEMVLRSFALSLLVPEQFYSRVRSYVERNRLVDRDGGGQRLDYICVGRLSMQEGDRIHPQSMLEKLEFKPRHDLSPWVRGNLLARFDFRCCESVDEFNDLPRLAMTENRHVKFNSERHQKDDRARTADPRHFVLGWDNTEKKSRIASHIRELESKRNELQLAIDRCGEMMSRLTARVNAARAALDVSGFDAIDVGRHEREIAALETEKRELEEANDAVMVLRDRLQGVESDETRLGKQRDDEMNRKGNLESEIRNARAMVQRAGDEISDARKSGVFTICEPVFESIEESLGEPPLAIETLDSRKNAWQRETDEAARRLRKPLQDLGEKLVNRMSNFLREFREEGDDLDASIQSLESFLALQERLRREDLPKHERKFKDRLNDQVTQEVALLNTELRQESRAICEKIDLLNEALANVDYNRGTLMKLEPRRVQDREIEEFRRSLSECLDGSMEGTDEANEARFDRIKSLVDRLGDNERTTWRNKVIDVRNWYDFAAQEVDRETGETRSSYDGSSGQSGGEKAKLAFTILVAALAYQFDVNPREQTPGRFQFVVVDEMFSKVDDQNANYAMQLFRQFGLQLLIVAPLDAKARVTEPFVDRYLHTVKDAQTSQSRLFNMTAQEYDAVVRKMVGGK